MRGKGRIKVKLWCIGNPKGRLVMSITPETKSNRFDVAIEPEGKPSAKMQFTRGDAYSLLAMLTNALSETAKKGE